MAVTIFSCLIYACLGLYDKYGNDIIERSSSTIMHCLRPTFLTIYRHASSAGDIIIGAVGASNNTCIRERYFGVHLRYCTVSALTHISITPFFLESHPSCTSQAPFSASWIVPVHLRSPKQTQPTRYAAGLLFSSRLRRRLSSARKPPLNASCALLTLFVPSIASAPNTKRTGLSPRLTQGSQGPSQAYENAATRTLSALHSRVSDYKGMVALRERRSGNEWRWLRNPNWDGEISIPEDVTPWERNMRPMRAKYRHLGTTLLVRQHDDHDARRLKCKIQGIAAASASSFGKARQAMEKKLQQDLTTQSDALELRAHEFEAQSKAVEVRAAQIEKDLSDHKALESQVSKRLTFLVAEFATSRRCFQRAVQNWFLELTKLKVLDLAIQLDMEMKKHLNGLVGGGSRRSSRRGKNREKGGSYSGDRGAPEDCSSLSGKGMRYHSLGGGIGNGSKDKTRMVEEEGEMGCGVGLDEDDLDAALGFENARGVGRIDEMERKKCCYPWFSVAK
ncbi:uncharacterized protein MYCFIDRAFT_180169 [Pseudocercospora fijiensis CIRAD86]|uniref:Uncharacterized protein n=1 Tax=Pseudocercospora fijiensis (strain CIRAD86) TaxID=383855 RepID=M2YH59_PSEFD|nr:uncharacterized protein MYCFIDRAFT_180169 [Pseudocercospora fijiensis CIRAD86]EME77160.1 hypothetical protein MYCFIDRAFT_180169 [Pseudocercospora fijiensis CIRAD86]